VSPAITEGYHRGELQITLDPDHPAHILPPSVPPSLRILDIGCGAGQTLIAAYPERVSFGLDVDLGALLLGKSLADHICFVCGQAESMPWPDGHFDLVIARVSLQYTNIVASLKEIHRVLVKGGTLWITFCPFSKLWKPWSVNYKGWIFYGYVMLNSLLFHVVQKQFSFFGKYESFQTERGVFRALRQTGFGDISIKRKNHFLATARSI
jgi:ubiquinone/menaquinone biosynthesis C-methylase UbiE